jgi:transcriptional regulator with XRE-family HTH domain
MSEYKIYEFSRHIGALCARRHTNIQELGAKLGVHPMLLLSMINGRIMPTKAVIIGLAKELDSDVRYLEKLTSEIKPGESSE